MKSYGDGMRRFLAWADREGRPAVLDRASVTAFTAALLDVGAGRELRDRRDEALPRLMIETGVRAGEVVAPGTGDVDLSTGTAVVRRGKGGRGRVVPFGPQTSRALDR